MLIYNARDKRYKSVVSALATDEKVRFKIIVSRDFACTGAKLAITKEGEETVFYDMFWVGMHEEYDEYWEVHFSATTSGLYFYHFELQTPWGINCIKNAGGGKGDFLREGAEFQQTVYDKDFKVPSFLQGGLIYQIFPDRFHNSGIPKTDVPKSRIMRSWGEEPYWSEEQMRGVWNNDYFGGDLKGIEQKLPYLADLGVSCIYLNPIFESHSNHRYDTADYEKIDSLLGTEEDLKDLCKCADKQGIKIILDGVFSHTGCDSKYFNMYNRYDTVGAYNSKDSPYFSWYKFINWNKEYHAWWGIKLLPELVEEDSSYRKYMCSENGIVRKWIRCGIGGWRLDVADELPDVFLDDLRVAVKAEDPNAIIIGEVWEDATTKFAYGQRRRYFQGRQLDSVMNYPFANAILSFVKEGNALAFGDAVMSIIENYPPNVLHVLMNHIGTHDTPRAITALAGPNMEGQGRPWQHENNVLSVEDYDLGVLRLKLASLIQYTLPGVPSLYYGDELGMQGMRDPFNRGCMKWDNGDETLLSWYKNLGDMRKKISVLKDGEFELVYAEHNSLAYCRTSKNEQLLVAVNAGDSIINISVGEQWDKAKSVFDTALKDGIIILEPYGYAVLIK